MMIELFILFYISSVLIAIGMFDVFTEIKIRDLLWGEFWGIMLLCFIPLANILLTIHILEIIRTEGG